MTYESHVHPIKVGLLSDMTFPSNYPKNMFNDLANSFNLIFKQGRENGIIDRAVELVYKEVEGLPKGTVKNVIDAFQELVDEGCVLVYGPTITDNSVPIREAIEARFHVPAIGINGSEEFLGDWTFSLPMGSMTDEPVFWAHLISERGLKTVGIIREQSLVGENYTRYFRRACADFGLQIVGEQLIPQVAADVQPMIDELYHAKPDALVHCGFGFGLIHINPALEKLGWNPPRYMGTAFENASLTPALRDAIQGWIGLDQYDEGNPVGQAFLDDYEAEYGYRPAYCAPLVYRDVATMMLHALADAHPLSPRGVRDALERVKMLKAASGAPGTWLSFGRYIHRGWVGSGYLVARELTQTDNDGDYAESRRVARFGHD